MKLITPQEHLGLCQGIIPLGVRPEMVPLAAATARITTQKELEDPHLLERLYLTRGRLEKALQDTFEVEREVKQVVENRLALVESNIRRMEHVPKIGLPTLDPSFLQWKNKKGYPAFSIYSLENPLCTISLQVRTLSNLQQGKGEIFSLSPEVPDIMAHEYLDKRLKATLIGECRAENLESIQLSAKYSGAMPESVRDLIHSYLRMETPCFESIFIVAEAPEWSRLAVRAIVIGDPLVVGVAHGLLWLIAAYDLTPAEKLVRSMCVSSARPGKN